MNELVGIVVAAAVGAGSGIFTTSWKTRKDLESQYDIDLRKLRIEAYSALWKELEPLAYYSPSSPLTYGALHRLSETLRDWYFQKGGLVLSERTRAPYFHLQQALTQLPGGPAREAHVKLDAETAAIVKALASRLRTSTTEDVATRVKSRLGPSVLVRPWLRQRKAVRLSIDRRWEWREDPIKPCYFVLIENRSFREIEVSGLSLNGVETTAVEPSRPLLVQAHESREVAVELNGLPSIGPMPRVEIQLSRGKPIRASDAPEIPIPAESLALPSHRHDQ
jgi:hypothetical protein